MKKSKILSLGALALASVCLFTGCSVSEKDGKEWAKENGYVKASDYNIDTGDATTSATSSGEGGLNFGNIAWSQDLIKEAIKEYLSGDNGNYREMYSVATSYNNKSSIANVEYVLDTETFELFGGSENGTEKLNEMKKNPNVSLYWTRQLREGDSLKTYFNSYGVQIEGKVKFYDYASLTGTEKTKFIATARNYFRTMGAQYAAFYNPDAQGYRDDAALISYFANAGTTYYSIVPTKIVVTSPYLLFLTKGESYKKVVDRVTFETNKYYKKQYTVTAEQPQNWADTYTTYFTESGGVYTPVAKAQTAPTWEASKYYSLSYVALNEKPQDFDAVTADYYQKFTYNVAGADYGEWLSETFLEKLFTFYATASSTANPTRVNNYYVTLTKTGLNTQATLTFNN